MPRVRGYFFIGLMLLLLAVSKFATSGESKEKRPRIEVQPLTTGVDTSPFEGSADYEMMPAPSQAASALPSPRVLDRLFARAGLASEVSTWDAVDRDTFYIRAKTLSPSALKARYPKLPLKKLSKLHELVQEAR